MAINVPYNLVVDVDRKNMPWFFRWRSFGRRRVINLAVVAAIFLCALFSAASIFFGPKSDDLVPDNVMVVLRESRLQKEYIDKKGIHVIVGQYNGHGLPWEPTPNLTDEILNSNMYLPLPHAGQMGQPVFLQQQEEQKARALFHINRFNLMVSDRIPVNRTLPDPRKESCKRQYFDVTKLGTTSIIIVFHNEAWSTLLRTVHSVINRSPHQLLEEIILVDDASSRTFLREPLEEYMRTLSNETRTPIRILRTDNRTGLIRARLLGADVATGDVLTFLDAHIEATKGWLEPLMLRISQNKTNVVCPIIDIISADTFAYSKSFELHWGAINWQMHFRWFPIGRSELVRMRKAHNEDTTPFRSPIMAGGLFSIHKDYFNSLGRYDSQMDIWGGENIELSLRVWMCGGRVEIVPCSHVAHIFRKSSPYTFPRPGGVSGVLYANLARVAEVWLDEWKYFYRLMDPAAKRAVDEHPNYDNIESRKLLRERLKCHSFEWFLENVWPEHFFPTKNRFFGQIRSQKTGHCLQRPTMKPGASGSSSIGRLDFEKCAIEPYGPQCFVYSKQGYLMTDDQVCLDIGGGYAQPVAGQLAMLLACGELSRQKWKYDTTTEQIVHAMSGLCLEIEDERKQLLRIQDCVPGKASQKWQMIAIDWTKESS